MTSEEFSSDEDSLLVDIPEKSEFYTQKVGIIYPQDRNFIPEKSVNVNNVDSLVNTACG